MMKLEVPSICLLSSAQPFSSLKRYAIIQNGSKQIVQFCLWLESLRSTVVSGKSMGFE